MLKVLLVKTSSLGDVVHNLPVVSDIRSRFPESSIDWAVEEGYAPLVRLHPAVDRVIQVAVRRWRNRPMGRSTWTEIGAVRRLLVAERYDAIIDTQGLIKSALIARAARGRSHGFSARSARETLASRFYEVTHHVAGGQHAVVRNRALAAAALGYRVEAPAEYGIVAGSALSPVEGRYAVLLHATSRNEKLWPEEHWVALGRELEARGLQCVVPWLSVEERSRSQRIASASGRTWVPAAPITLEIMAALLANAAVVIGVDTGLVHLAAALGTPVAAIYCATDPALTGVYGAPRARNLGGPGRVPAVGQVMAALTEVGAS
jgi:heptosyltransferase-1